MTCSIFRITRESGCVRRPWRSSSCLAAPAPLRWCTARNRETHFMKEPKELLAPSAFSNSDPNGDSLPAVPERITMYPSYAQAEPEAEEPIVPLSHYLWILRRHKWRILAFVAACVISTVIVSSRLTPVYEATATIDVDREAPTTIIGQDTTRSYNDDADQFLGTQMKTIQSDSVLRPVVQQFHLPVNEEARGSSKLAAARAANAPISLPSLKVTRPTNTYLLRITY